MLNSKIIKFLFLLQNKSDIFKKLFYPLKKILYFQSISIKIKIFVIFKYYIIIQFFFQNNY